VSDTRTKAEKHDKRVAQGTATRVALLQAARELFGERGFAATATEDVVARAGVTKGALYHHFGGKEHLFRAVFEQVSTEVSDEACGDFLLPDSWAALVLGCNRWVDAYLDPAVQRIVLRDARAVLGWETVRDIETRYAAVALRGALRKAMHAGVITRQPLRPLALMLIGALRESCFYVADSHDQATARSEVSHLIELLLTSLRVVDQQSTGVA